MEEGRRFIMNFFDMLLAKKLSGGGGSSAVLISKNITENGTYNASSDNADGYSSVSVEVEPDLTTKSITENGTYNAASDNADGYSAVTVDVPNSYAASDEGKVVSNGALVAQTSTSVSQNGTINTTTNNSVTVNVANTYTQADEGKVVSNGALVAQGSDTVTQNGVIDTTLINSLTVNVAASGGAVKLEHNYTGGDAYIIETDNCIEIFGYLSGFTKRPSFTIPSTFDISKIGTEIGGSVYTGPSSIASFTNLGITDRTIQFQVANYSLSTCLVFSYAFNKAT
jgi:hypothetical protein